MWCGVRSVHEVDAGEVVVEAAEEEVEEFHMDSGGGRGPPVRVLVVGRAVGAVGQGSWLWGREEVGSQHVRRRQTHVLEGLPHVGAGDGGGGSLGGRT